MGRPLGMAVENGWYHVLNRGIDGRQLFPDDRANEHFLELLKSMPARFNLRIHAKEAMELWVWRIASDSGIRE